MNRNVQLSMALAGALFLPVSTAHSTDAEASTEKSRYIVTFKRTLDLSHIVTHIPPTEPPAAPRARAQNPCIAAVRSRWFSDPACRLGFG